MLLTFCEGELPAATTEKELRLQKWQMLSERGGDINLRTKNSQREAVKSMAKASVATVGTNASDRSARKKNKETKAGFIQEERAGGSVIRGKITVRQQEVVTPNRWHCTRGKDGKLC